MIQTKHDADHLPDAEQECAELLDELTKRMQCGKPLELESLLQEFPQHAERLKRLLPGIRLMVDLGNSVANDAVPIEDAPSRCPCRRCSR